MYSVTAVQKSEIRRASTACLFHVVRRRRSDQAAPVFLSTPRFGGSVVKAGLALVSVNL